MNIYYNPNYTGETWLDLNGHPLLMDTLVANTIALVQEIELRVGIHCDMPDVPHRLVAYCCACQEFFSEHKDNIFSKSFDLDNLNVARELLKWRDELTLTGWIVEKDYRSERLSTIAGIERIWQKNMLPGLSDRIRRLLQRQDLHECMPENTAITLNTDLELLHPAIKRLIKQLNVKIHKVEYPKTEEANNLYTLKRLLTNAINDKITLNDLKDDPSLRILEFADEQDALRYIASTDEFRHDDVWIDTDSKALDNRLYLQGKSTVGSSAKGISQPMQFLQLSLMLFPDDGKATDVNALLQWLYSAVNPIDHIFLHTLAETIVRCGGCYHPMVQRYIDNYRVGKEVKDFTQPAEVIAQRQKQLAKYFDPMWENDVELFLNNIKGFSGDTDAMIPLLKAKPGDVGTSEWMNNLLTVAEERQYPAEVGSPWLVSSPAQMAAPARSTLWCDCYNIEQQPLTTEFLTVSERQELEEHGAELWQPERERQFNDIQQIIPVLMTTDRLTLVTCRQKGSNPVQKHPILIRLETAAKGAEKDAMDKITVKPTLKTKDLSHQPCFDNSAKDKYKVQLTSKEAISEIDGRIREREHESQTSLNSLVQNPMDYFFNYILNLQPEDTAAMGEVGRLRGIVAHAIIEHLFDPAKTGHHGTATDIAEYYEQHYEEVFNRQMRENGGIFLLDENRIALETFHGLMQNVISHLLAIIGNNRLTVVECEAKADGDIPELPKSITGSIDMLLKDEKGNPVIFDFKYSTSRHYRDLLVNNTSIQLLLYKEVVARDGKRNPNHLWANDIRSGYFLMPNGVLYTTNRFDDERYIVRRNVSNERKDKNLLQELVNAYNYRMEQFHKGFIETAEGQPLSDHDKDGNVIGEGCKYAIDNENGAVDLIPLETANASSNFYTLKKKINGFSDYTLFK